jgi:hypothetical protein
MMTVVSYVRASLATLVLLSVPGFAVYSLIHSGLSVRGDDPIPSGLRIVDAPEVATGAPPADANEVLVKDFTFTGGPGGKHKGKPSPFQ